MAIHPTAIIHPSAEIGSNVSIAPYAIIGSRVRVGDECEIGPHVVIEGRTTIGPRSRIYSGACIGVPSQDLKWDGEENRLEIGSDNIIREYVTINPSSHRDRLTRIGSHNLLMAYVHVAHDCLIGDRVILPNNVTFAGHVVVEDDVTLGGLVGVHQDVRLGRMSFLGGFSKITMDVAPFVRVDGRPARSVDINRVAMTRKGVSKEAQDRLRKVFRIYFRSGSTSAVALKEMENGELGECSYVQHFVRFVQQSKRGILR